MISTLKRIKNVLNLGREFVSVVEVRSVEGEELVGACLGMGGLPSK